MSVFYKSQLIHFPVQGTVNLRLPHLDRSPAFRIFLHLRIVFDLFLPDLDYNSPIKKSSPAVRILKC